MMPQRGDGQLVIRAFPVAGGCYLSVRVTRAFCRYIYWNDERGAWVKSIVDATKFESYGAALRYLESHRKTLRQAAGER